MTLLDSQIDKIGHKVTQSSGSEFDYRVIVTQGSCTKTIQKSDFYGSNGGHLSEQILKGDSNGRNVQWKTQSSDSLIDRSVSESTSKDISKSEISLESVPKYDFNLRKNADSNGEIWSEKIKSLKSDSNVGM